MNSIINWGVNNNILRKRRGVEDGCWGERVVREV